MGDILKPKEDDHGNIIAPVVFIRHHEAWNPGEVAWFPLPVAMQLIQAKAAVKPGGIVADGYAVTAVDTTVSAPPEISEPPKKGKRGIFRK